MRLPSYSAAVTEPSVWELVVRCCDTSSLRNLCRVCSYINEPATRELWSNPIPRILDLPKPCVRVIYFFDHALLVRQKIRNQVRTLDLRKLGASSLMRQQCRGKHFRETCEMTINGVWVCQKLYLFPNLRFLLLDELTGFRNTVFASFGPDQEAEMSRVYPLMISAANCFSLYPIRLLTSRHLLSVLYLDLSGARANDAWRTYLVPELLPRLRVLKLRNTNLNDGNIPPILVFEATQIWSVDLRDNNFTDGIVPALIGMSANKLECRQSYEDISPDNKYDDDPPRYSQDGFDPEVLRTMQDVVSFRPDEEDTFMKYLSLHGDMLSQTPIEISDPIIRLTGLTHLYISGNRFSQYGVSSILKSKLGSRLQYLDVGSVTGTTSQLSHNPWGASKLYSQTVGVEYLARSCAMRLEVLRIHHSIITNVSSIGNPRIPPGELPYIAELRPDIIDQRVSPLSSPDTNPRIHTLILTDVPRRTRGPVIDRLKAFITACAIQEQEIATVIRVNSPLTRRSPKILPGLQILRLEFQELDQKQYHINNNRSSNNLFTSYGSGSSVSGDPDADEFIAQSQNDFSFFSSSSDNDRPRRTKSPPTSPSTNIPRTLAASRNVAQELQAWRLWGAGREWGGRLEMRFREYGNDEYRDVGGRVVWAGPDICVEG